MRDKLIELMNKAMLTREKDRLLYGEARLSFEEFADYLLAHGVTLATDTNVGGKKPLTNGDRIRAMSDEELANQLMFWRDDWGDFETPCGCYEDRDEASRKTVEWLKQPAKEET